MNCVQVVVVHFETFGARCIACTLTVAVSSPPGARAVDEEAALTRCNASVDTFRERCKAAEIHVVRETLSAAVHKLNTVRQRRWRRPRPVYRIEGVGVQLPAFGARGITCTLAVAFPSLLADAVDEESERICEGANPYAIKAVGLTCRRSRVSHD